MNDNLPAEELFKCNQCGVNSLKSMMRYYFAVNQQLCGPCYEDVSIRDAKLFLQQKGYEVIKKE